MARTAIVVGAGIGGLSAARALELGGWEVSLFDQAPAFRPVGAGIGIAPNAVKALRWLGVDTPILTNGVRQTGMAIRLSGGQSVACFEGDEIERRFGDPFVALHRAELHRILLESLDSVAQHTDHRAIAIAPGVDGATVEFVTPRGTVVRSADLVVAADGVQSQLRGRLFPDYPGPTYAGYTVWRGIVPADRVARLGITPVLTETWGRAARFGIAVIGNGGQVYWFACESMPEGATPQHDLGKLAHRFRAWHTPIPEVLAATPQDSLVRHDVYYLKTPLPSFVRGHVALLGDAAHAVTPDIGQGACLAIEDAVVLAATLDRADLDGALTEYDIARRPRTQQLAAASGRLGRILQLANPIATQVRDTVVRMIPAPMFARFAAGAFDWTPPTPSARAA